MMDIFTPITNAECVVPPVESVGVGGKRKQTRRVAKKRKTYRKRRNQTVKLRQTY